MILLVHSPLVGPATWERVAATARARGLEAVVPDLRGSAVEGDWQEMIHTAASAATGSDGTIVAGHSGAGAILPAIAGLLEPTLSGLVFVDAVLPPEEGAWEPTPKVRRLLDSKSKDGTTLTNWFDWWPEEDLHALVPDSRLIAQLRDESPRVARKLYEQQVGVPLDWSRYPTSYLQLSSAYSAEAVDARRRGWVVSVRDSHHLGIVTDPEPVLDAIVGDTE